MTTNNSSRQKLMAIAAVIVVGLLAINAFLLYNKYSQDKVIEQQNAQLEEADQLKIELEKQYHESLSELEEMRGSNEELNVLIDQQKAELKVQKTKIGDLIRNGNDLVRAREEINNLTTQVQQYLAEIDQLKVENKDLKGENFKLVRHSQSLKGDLETQQSANRELESEKANLLSQQKKLAGERDVLASTVSFASVVKVKNVNVTGLKTKGSGRSVKKKYAKNIDQLKVCFQTTVNEVAQQGVEKFYVRIINPIGETMAIDELGSGIIINKKTNEEIRYTHVKEYEYSNDEKELCFLWLPGMPFTRGSYQVEIYNKGHLAGVGKFSLK